ncbi:GmrSD restriction endonuclease domain-containing protein [Bifidobacterium scaligerum]|uniref:DUF262 domain-containing protein n=1 Tax=Bifidobacterium scaligerum TaxID=2052656 RepID=A0A2M9HS96_9BIFI|nr:DUF262 domain-containing protein [Bifidobacterium scaligerum]PJM79693.1 hypothetical protein CUU80_00610 [Bifidobacterium scaligerum]
MTIKANELPLGKVFTPDFRFIIPSFQRAYIWKPENILQLVGDLKDASVTPGAPYFLGSLILVREEKNRFLVIDGQQRLVSLSIIIAVLRDLEQDPDLMRQLDALLVEPGDKLRCIVNEPRLTLRERDAAFFREHVQEDNLESVFDMNDADLATAAQRNIVHNIKKTYDEISNWSVLDRQRFAQYLVNEVTLVIVTTDDLDGAHRIFDVMNMRGLPLTPSDVFKARATSGLAAAELDAYAARWDDIVDPIGDDPQTIEEFFSYLHLILTHLPATDKLIEDFLAEVLQPYLNAGTVGSFINGVLAPYAMAWRIIDHPGETILPPEVRHRLEALNDYHIHEWKPVAMWALVHSYRELGDPDVSPFVQRGARAARRTSTLEALGVHDGQRLLDILKALEQVTGIRTLNRTGTLERRGFANAAIRDLDKGYLVERINGLRVGDADREGALVRLHGEMQGDDDLIRLLLIRANEQLAGVPLPRPRRFSALPIMPLTIEHAASFADWTQDSHDFWMYRLGNMALVQGPGDQLDKLGEYIPRRDRMLLRADSRRFPLTKELGGFNDCTPTMLERRQEETIRLIVEYWGIRYDANNKDLIAQPLEELNRGTVKSSRGSRRVSIRQVVQAGLLTPGERLVWDRPRKGERWYATVTENGRLRLDDGSEYPTPTAAARAAAGGRRGGGLDVWKRAANGKKLSDIWKQFRLQVQ